MEISTTSLNNAVEQLSKKREKLTEIDGRLLELLDDAKEIELAVLEAEELNDDITDKIARTRRFIELHSSKRLDRDSTPVTEKPSLTSESSIESQANSTLISDQLQDTQVSESITSINQAQLEPSQPQLSTAPINTSPP